MADGAGDNACRICGEEGHFSRECPSKPPGSDNCRKCGEEGHMARDCTLPDTCRRCKEEGHMAAECSLPEICRKCKEEHPTAECSLPDVCRRCKAEGHMIWDCELPEVCNRCGEEGHRVSECTEEEKTRTITDEDGTEREIYVPKNTTDEELYAMSISAGDNFGNYKNLPVEIKGENVPPPVTDFLCLRPLLLDNVVKSNYTSMTPIQMHCISAVTAKRDVLACSQTGSGKTAAFLLPIVNSLLAQGLSATNSREQSPQAIIVTPTRELANQINNHARKFCLGSALKSVAAYGGTSMGNQLRNLEAGCNIIVGTMGRILGYIEIGKLLLDQIQFVVLDEADRMLDEGFGPDIEKLLASPGMPPKAERNTLMFSATYTAPVLELCAKYQKEDFISVTMGVGGTTCVDVKQEFIEIDKEKKVGKKGALMEVLEDPERDPADLVIVFVNKIDQAEFLANLLCEKEKPCTSIHSKRLQREREEALWDFRTGKFPILVATGVMARGLDVPAVQLVINYDMPYEIDEYVHRIGRTGRVGNPGRSVTLFESAREGRLAKKLVALLEKSSIEVPDFITESAENAPEEEEEGTVGTAADGGEDEDEEW
jgi:probable ATP-dependent RNA helicase DDX4